MAQHDYIIDNGPGAAVRADLNSALAAIQSQNSGGTAPAAPTYPPVAYMPWADTATGIYKIRNAANDGWIPLYELDGTYLFQSGSAASPGACFVGDTDTGIYSPGANQWAVSTNGVQRFLVDASGVPSFPSADVYIQTHLRVGLGPGSIDNNVALGKEPLNSNTNGFANVAIGYRSLYSNTTGDLNVAVGYETLRDNEGGIYNVAVGAYALQENTTGSSNVAVGNLALSSNTTGITNSAFGAAALYFNTTGNENSAVGDLALQANTTGSNNTAIGHRAGRGASGGNTTGSNNTFVGNDAVGASATASNVITLGNSSITTLRCQVTTITSLSDERDKKDIATLAYGLDFVSKLRPVSFTWNTRDGAKVDVEDTGFSAQELLAAQEETGITVPNLVNQENPDKLEAGYGTLIPVLVKAVQELTTMVRDLQDEIAALKGGLQ
jgi:hypothetical protein